MQKLKIFLNLILWLHGSKILGGFILHYSLIIILFSQKFKLMKKCHFWSQRGKIGEIRSKTAKNWLQKFFKFWSHLEPNLEKCLNSSKNRNFVAPMAPRWLQDFWSQYTKMPPLKLSQVAGDYVIDKILEPRG